MLANDLDMVKDDWKQKRAIGAVMFGRSVASFAQVAEYMMRLLAQTPLDERLVFRGDPEEWLALYRDPRLVRDRLVDLVFPVDPGETPISSLLPMLIWQIGRMHRQSVGDLIAEAGGMPALQAQFKASVEMWRWLDQQHEAWLQAEFAGEVDPVMDAEIERLLQHPEALFMFRVYMPCILTTHRTPWRLFRAARGIQRGRESLIGSPETLRLPTPLNPLAKRLGVESTLRARGRPRKPLEMLSPRQRRRRRQEQKRS